MKQAKEKLILFQFGQFIIISICTAQRERLIIKYYTYDGVSTNFKKYKLIISNTKWFSNTNDNKKKR